MIISLCGYSRTGKDTVADYLVREYSFHRISFADPLRVMAIEMNPIIRGKGVAWDGISMDLWSWMESFAVDNRPLATESWNILKMHTDIIPYLQNLGAEKRKEDPLYWVKQVDIRIDNMAFDSTYLPDIVIPDCRFTNEFDYIKRNEGQVWKVIRKGVGMVNNSVSEREHVSFKCDHNIYNYWGIQELTDQVDRLLSKCEL